MAGPVVEVLLPSYGPPAEHRALADIVAGMQLAVEPGGKLPRLDFRDAAELPYSLEVHGWPPGDLEDDEALEVEAAAGFRPASSLVMIAHTNDTRSHRTLGSLAFAVAERTRGWIDFEGGSRRR